MPEPAPAQPAESQGGHAGHETGTPATADPHAGHGTDAPPSTDPHAGHGTDTPATADPHAGHGTDTPTSTDPHAGHGTDTPTSTDPHAGHGTDTPATADPHAGHGTDTPPSTDSHAGHDAPAPAPPVGPPPPSASSGPEHAADTLFGSPAMAAARTELHRMHGALRVSRFTIDQLEIGIGAGATSYAWEDVQFWHGGDLDKLWLKSEGEGRFGEGLERGDVQALWSHAIDPWFDLQAGVRMNFGPGPERPHLVLGVQGLAPYWFEIDAAVFLSSAGDLTARAEAEYDLRITQRLILQPRVEAELALQDVPELGIGAGLSGVEAGLRLRYEIVREFAPYVGVEYARSLGDTARFARAAGEDAGGWRLVLGTRLWF